MAFRSMNIDLNQIQDYLMSTESSPLDFTIPIYPIPNRPNRVLDHIELDESRDECYYEWLPSLKYDEKKFLEFNLSSQEQGDKGKNNNPETAERANHPSIVENDDEKMETSSENEIKVKNETESASQDDDSVSKSKLVFKFTLEQVNSNLVANSDMIDNSSFLSIPTVNDDMTLKFKNVFKKKSKKIENDEIDDLWFGENNLKPTIIRVKEIGKKEKKKNEEKTPKSSKKLKEPKLSLKFGLPSIDGDESLASKIEKTNELTTETSTMPKKRQYRRKAKDDSSSERPSKKAKILDEDKINISDFIPSPYSGSSSFSPSVKLQQQKYGSGTIETDDSLRSFQQSHDNNDGDDDDSRPNREQSTLEFENDSPNFGLNKSKEKSKKSSKSSTANLSTNSSSSKRNKHYKSAEVIESSDSSSSDDDEKNLTAQQTPISSLTESIANNEDNFEIDHDDAKAKQKSHRAKSSKKRKREHQTESPNFLSSLNDDDGVFKTSTLDEDVNTNNDENNRKDLGVDDDDIENVVQESNKEKESSKHLKKLKKHLKKQKHHGSEEKTHKKHKKIKNKSREKDNSERSKEKDSVKIKEKGIKPPKLNIKFGKNNSFTTSSSSSILAESSLNETEGGRSDDIEIGDVSFKLKTSQDTASKRFDKMMESIRAKEVDVSIGDDNNHQPNTSKKQEGSKKKRESLKNRNQNVSEREITDENGAEKHWDQQENVEQVEQGLVFIKDKHNNNDDEERDDDDDAVIDSRDPNEKCLNTNKETEELKLVKEER
ncbi:hypothetical protein QR98_0006870 [Sarcoptes scabiei]|uniref:Uncharacterized protein n=1 Tax=Sarcoptes scabiei TaxID=52283 RepID=A0A131ZU35_SARSC|nr:hypothetical protein QR98_0006870 [Sarcoptes scabiei]